MPFSCTKGTARVRRSQGIRTNISCWHSASGAIPTTSTSSPTRSGEMLRSAVHVATKGEVQLVLEGVVPAHGLLFGTIGVDDDLHGDALFPLLIARWSLHPVSWFACDAVAVFSALAYCLGDEEGIGTASACALRRRDHVSFAPRVSRP